MFDTDGRCTGAVLWGSMNSAEMRRVMFQVDVMSRTPVYEQIVEQLEQFVLTGIVKAGDKLPSVRTLSMQLAVNPNTIQKAYSELDRRGLIQSVPGRGCFVAETAADVVAEKKSSQLADLVRLVTELAYAGISRQMILQEVEKAYDAAKNQATAIEQ